MSHVPRCNEMLCFKYSHAADLTQEVHKSRHISGADSYKSSLNNPIFCPPLAKPSFSAFPRRISLASRHLPQGPPPSFSTPSSFPLAFSASRCPWIQLYPCTLFLLHRVIRTPDSTNLSLLSLGEVFALLFDSRYLYIMDLRTERVVGRWPLPAYRKSKRGSSFLAGETAWLSGLNGKNDSGLVFATSMPDHSIHLVLWRENGWEGTAADGRVLLVLLTFVRMQNLCTNQRRTDQAFSPVLYSWLPLFFFKKSNETSMFENYFYTLNLFACILMYRYRKGRKKNVKLNMALFINL